MARRAHNSTFPEVIYFKGREYPSPTEIHRSVSPPPEVSLQTFLARLRKRAGAEGLTESLIEETLYTSASAYKRLHAVRKSWVEIDGNRFSLEAFYEREQARATVDYRVFWQRLRRFREAEQLKAETLEDALTLPNAEWISFYGGGRARRFTYVGDLYPELSGQEFNSVSAFLKTVGRYSDKALVWSRLKSGWNLYDALSIPVDGATDRMGLIYVAIRTRTGEVYVGLTRVGVEQRWAFHVSAARRGSTTRLAQAIREEGVDGFEVRVLEDGIKTSEELQEREIHWATTLGATGPSGLNVAKPGGLGSTRGVEIEYEGEVFRSIAEAARAIGRRRKLAPHVVEARLRSGLPLPAKAREHSKHPDAGSNLFRRWLALKKRHEGDIHSAWENDYDVFKADVGTEYDASWKLLRIDVTRPWGPDNWRWGTATAMVEATHGQQVAIHGTVFPSYAAVAREYGVGVSTLKNRIQVQGLSPEEAVQKPLGRTSFRRSGGQVKVGSRSFRSKRQAILHFAEKHGLTEGQARYRLEKGELE